MDVDVPMRRLCLLCADGGRWMFVNARVMMYACGRHRGLACVDVCGWSSCGDLWGRWYGDLDRCNALHSQPGLWQTPFQTSSYAHASHCSHAACSVLRP